jgi:hypothetical protein
MLEFSVLWDNAQEYLKQGISVIPIRDKDEEIGGKIFTRKSPFRTWKKYQNEIIAKEQLWWELEEYKTAAIGTICGKVSGNLEAIDIDVKWMAGIDQQLFNEVKNINPTLYSRLRIHKSPSGGFHILYRVALDCIVPGSEKISSRQSTDAEIAQDLKERPDAKPNSTKCFIETRGEGGYVAAPPSVGYSIHQDVPIPILTWEERCELINICASFNQVFKEDTGYKPTKNDNKYYDENPFEHFNNSSEGEQVLLDNGWTYHSKNNRAIYFSRPGSKSMGIHATFLRGGRFFYFFTTNSDFENKRCYKPATVLAKIQFGGNKQNLYRFLVSKGYGKIKQQIERSLVKSRVLVGGELPINASAEAKQQYQQAVVLNADKHPHGTFWEQDEKWAWEINREKLYTVAEGLGFRYLESEQQLCQIENYLIHKRSARWFIDALKGYIKEEDGDTWMKICNEYEAWMESHVEFVITRMPLLEEESIIVDSDTYCYKFFNNGYLFITAEEIVFKDYDALVGLIWAERIQNRNYTKGDASIGKYYEFLKLAVRYDLNKEYIDKVIGFLAHEYKDAATPFIIVLTEEVPDPKQGGGTGKNLFSTLLSLTTTYQSIAGSQISMDSKFMQAWNGEKIYALSDVPKKFDFMFLKDLSSGKGVLKKLWKDEMSIEISKMPKIIVLTNYSYDVSDGGLKRRIIPIEFTNYFTVCGGVDTYFGCMFPDGWMHDDWCGYDNLIAEAVQVWLKYGRKLAAKELSGGGFEKQFDQMYPDVRAFFEKCWPLWSADYYVTNEDFKTLWTDYCNDQGIKEMYRPKMNRLNEALKDWCREKKFTFEKDKVKRIEGKAELVRVKEFLPINAPF